MATLNTKTMELIAAFQRYVKYGDASEIHIFDLPTLKLVDVQIGNRDWDAPFRIALRNRIQELEGVSVKKYQSWVRVVGYIVVFALSVLSTHMVNWLFR